MKPQAFPSLLTDLGSIHSISREEAGFFTGHAKILLRFKALGSDEASPGLVKLSFQAGGRDEVFELLGNLLKRREWAVPLVGPSFKKPDVALSPIVVSSMPGISSERAAVLALKVALFASIDVAAVLPRVFQGSKRRPLPSRPRRLLWRRARCMTSSH